jgi:ankyrin repeat protein
MRLTQYLPFDARLTQYDAQAHQLLGGHAGGDATAIEVLRNTLPRFLDPEVTWKPLHLSDGEIQAAPLTIDDARLALARAYSFRDWAALTMYVNEVSEPDSPVRQFEAAVEAVITGDLAGLRAMLTANPALVRTRSTRVTCHDPAVHAATLLHYLGANGVEGYRQRSPANAVDIAVLLLERGAGVDALAGMYGGQYATLSMLISSSPPADAGVQVALVHTLLDHGATIDGIGSPTWQSPVLTALIFGFRDAAEAVAARGASVDRLVIAAGLGRLDTCRALLASASATERHQALALSALTGHVDIVELLLDAGESPDRFNPDGMHTHQTPLHSAALSGNLALAQLLVTRGAQLNTRDTIWNSTPLGWARYAGHEPVATYLLGQGATDD